MNRRIAAIASGVALVLVAAGCSPKPQSVSQDVPKGAQPPWAGGQPAFNASGWKVGDKASWQREIDRRAQAQNEYVRMRQ